MISKGTVSLGTYITPICQSKHLIAFNVFILSVLEKSYYCYFHRWDTNAWRDKGEAGNLGSTKALNGKYVRDRMHPWGFVHLISEWTVFNKHQDKASKWGFTLIPSARAVYAFYISHRWVPEQLATKESCFACSPWHLYSWLSSSPAVTEEWSASYLIFSLTCWLELCFLEGKAVDLKPLQSLGFLLSGQVVSLSGIHNNKETF